VGSTWTDFTVSLRTFTGMLGRSTIIAVLALAAAPIQALATPQDIAATHAYIEANYALAQASVARIGAAQAKIEHLNGDLARECPRVGTGSPEDEASQPISYDVAVALWSLAYGTDAGPIHTFLDTAGRLRWSNHTITRAAETYASDLHELATLPMPDLCADVRSWKASGFQVIPAATVSLVRRVEAIEPKTIPPRLLAPFERGADASILARTTRLETKLEETEFVVGQSDWLQTLETLGLNE
jgi:hypothetical protein